MNLRNVAAIAHEANRMLCLAHGDDTQPEWDGAPDWQVASAIDGVLFHVWNPRATPAASHENWLKEKISDGWVYGETKDPEAKTHPCMVAFEQLPLEQQAKDHLFRGIVRALEPFITEERTRP